MARYYRQACKDTGLSHFGQTRTSPLTRRFAIGIATIGHGVNGRMDHEWLFRDSHDFLKQIGLAK